MFRYSIYYLSLLFLLIGCTKRSDNTGIYTKPSYPKQGKTNVILLLGDGMGLSQITAARTINGGNLNMLSCKSVGLLSTHANDWYTTDSGASATAMACGEKTNHYTVGVDTEGNPIPNLFELLATTRYATGIITTSTIVHATPAAFYAHNTNRFAYEDIARDLVHQEVDFVAGGGKQFFDQRSDSVNLLDTMQLKGVNVCNDLNGISENAKNLVLIADNHPSKFSEGRGDFLSNALSRALDVLSKRNDGFFVVVEGAQIDWACDTNDEPYLLDEMKDFDNAVGVALAYADSNENTLVIITSDHETGGYSLLDGSVSENQVEGAFLTFEHTATLVPVFAKGPGEQYFQGTYENTEIFHKLVKIFGL